MGVSDVLLISGLPGAGKSHFAEWLADRGWGRVDFDFEPAAHPILTSAWGGDDGPMLAEATKYPQGLVFEWGFSTVSLPELQGMIRRGYNAWYFDGDRDAAFQSWRQNQKHKDVPDAAWYLQVQRLDYHWDRISVLYRSRTITTIGPGGYYLPEEAISRLIGLP